MLYIAPSLLAADFSNLLGEITRVEEAGANYLHLDGGSRNVQIEESHRGSTADNFLKLFSPNGKSDWDWAVR